MGEPSDFYAILGVPPDAPLRLIRRSYRLIALKSHPDTNPGDDAAAERFRLATEAYEVLSDPERRAAYDIQRRGDISPDADPFNAPRPTPGFQGSFEQADAAWETIQKQEAMWEEARQREQAAVKAAMATGDNPAAPPNASSLQLFLLGVSVGIIVLLGSLIGSLFFW